MSTINLIFPHGEKKKKKRQDSCLKKQQCYHWSQQYLGNMALDELQM